MQRLVEVGFEGKVQRIEQAGFECEVLSTADMGPNEQRLYALRHPVFQEVFLCYRPLDA
jgi:hypothetical protein